MKMRSDGASAQAEWLKHWRQEQNKGRKLVIGEPNLDSMLKATRIMGAMDSLLFAQIFFPKLCRLRFSPFHTDLFHDYDMATLMEDDVLQRTGRGLAIAAPRGAAKSSILSLILPIHAICYARERYILIISATLKQARQRLRNIQRELSANDYLRREFGEFAEDGAAWNTQTLQTRGVQVDVFSAGSEMRGVSTGEFRPTLIILDDAENSEAVESAERREKMRQWFHEVVENLGDRYTRLVVAGTLMHPDSLLRGLLRRPDFKAHSYSSIVRWAEAGALWDEWRRLYTNLDDPRRRHTARRFFKARREEMLAGAEVLWEVKEDYYTLMEQLATRGRQAFFQEKQNDPLTNSDGLFRLERFAWFEIADGAARPAIGPDWTLGTEAMDGAIAPNFDFVPVPIDDMQTFGFLDPAIGAKGRGDFAAIAVVGRDTAGTLYVLDVWRKRKGPSVQAQSAHDLHANWNFTAFGVEANLFQELLMGPLGQEAAQRGGAPRLNLRPVTHATNKERRILALEPHIANGWLRFNRDLPRDVLLEFADFPRSVHDDAMDAIEGAVALAREGRAAAAIRTTGARTSRSATGY